MQGTFQKVRCSGKVVDESSDETPLYIYFLFNTLFKGE